MIRILPYSETAPEEVFARVVPEVDVTGTVREIIATVIRDGDQALLEYCRRFDGAELTALEVTQQEIDEAVTAVPETLLEILREAAANGVTVLAMDCAVDVDSMNIRKNVLVKL